ncbi:MAG: EamA family transporter [Bacteroidota bacterium]|nr:EamA family transporter [Bacteroidota bacterium]
MALTTKQKAYIALAATSFLWGTTWVASKVAVINAPPLQVSAMRQFIAGLIYIVFFKLKGEPWPTPKQLKPLLIMSFFLLIIANGFATWSIKYISSGLAALIAALYPLFVVIIEMIFYKTKNTIATFIGLLLGLAGICVVFYDNAFHHNSSDYLFGVILALIAMLSWAIGTIFVARKKLNINPYYGMGWQMMLAAPFIFIMSLGTGTNISLTQIPAQTWMALAYLVILGSCIAFVCFIYTMKHLPAAIASLYAYINPIVAMLVGYLLLSEKLTINILIGTAITIFGVYLVNHSLKEVPTTEPIENEI